MNDLQQTRIDLLASHLAFTKVFFELKTGRAFDVPFPEGRHSHFHIISNALEQVFDGTTKNLIINVAPRYGKTTLVSYFVAWALASYPDSNFLYVSYAKSLAKLQTQTIKEIINMPAYEKLFNVRISDDSSAKDDFATSAGGSVFAAGAGGPITGRGAGIKGANRFGGAIIIDDIHKPIEVTSDTMRQQILDWYENTLQSRVNDRYTPVIFIGQRLHEDDLPAKLMKSGDWKIVSLETLDKAGNALYPQMHTKEMLLKMESENPYIFAAQYQQNPQPAGGGLFKPEWFVIKDEEPEIISTFITVDTAETEKSYNDASSFSFWGIYKIFWNNTWTGEYGLHWLDCVELRVEPKDLEREFFGFYTQCMRYKVKPSVAVIEAKSTGSLLISVFKSLQGLRIIEENHTRGRSGLMPKMDRFIQCQSYVASKRISLPREGHHTSMVIEHCRKITANNSHAFDDIADTMQLAIATALRDGILLPRNDESNTVVKELAAQFNSIQRLKEQARWQPK